MNRVPFVLTAIAVAILAGCATEDRVTSAPAPVVVTPATPQASAAGTVIVAPAAVPLRVGFGRIESILAVPNAAAGGTASGLTRRIVMRMEDGSAQYFDTEAAGVAVGDRVEITKDGALRHPA
jgi:hypothetical protein